MLVPIFSNLFGFKNDLMSYDSLGVLFFTRAYISLERKLLCQNWLSTTMYYEHKLTKICKKCTFDALFSRIYLISSASLINLLLLQLFFIHYPFFFLLHLHISMSKTSLKPTIDPIYPFLNLPFLRIACLKGEGVSYEIVSSIR